MTAEAGSTIKVSSSAAGEVLSVPATGAAQELAFDLPVGVHALSIVAVDGAGNASPPLSSNATYSAPSAPRLSKLRGTEAAPLRLKVLGAPNDLAHVVLSDGQVVDVRMDSSGDAEVEFVVADGGYTVDALAVDRRGTASAVSHLAVKLDTVAPRLSLKVIKKAAEDGELRLRVHAEEGSRVRIVSKKAKVSKRFRSGSTAKVVEKDIDEGTYRVKVTATDAAGNTTVRKAKITIE
ncbi:MAG: hypothetical protein WEC34_16085 [Acidimicrobiia bacterium]